MAAARYTSEDQQVDVAEPDVFVETKQDAAPGGRCENDRGEDPDWLDADTFPPWPNSLRRRYVPRKGCTNYDKGRAVLHGLSFLIGFAEACLVTHARMFLSSRCYLDPYYQMGRFSLKGCWAWCEMPLYFGLASSSIAFSFLVFTFLDHIRTSTRMMTLQIVVGTVGALVAFANGAMVAIGLNAWCLREIKLAACHRSNCAPERREIHTCMAALSYSDSAADNQHVIVYIDTIIFMSLSWVMGILWLACVISAVRDYRKALVQRWDPNDDDQLMDSDSDSSDSDRTYNDI